MSNNSISDLNSIKAGLSEGLEALAADASTGDADALKELRAQLQIEEYIDNIKKMDEDESAG